LQLYLWQDRSLSYQLIERARRAGYQALVVTVDGAVLTNREYNRRNDFTVPMSFTPRNVTDVMLHPGWMFGVFIRYLLKSGMPRYENFPAEFDNRITAKPVNPRIQTTASLNAEDIRVLRKLWPHTLIVKGILHPQDALLAAECGADAVVVSNHGGRNLDSTMAPIEVLPEIVDAVGKRVTVIVDSGFRRGGDVVKALALGAQAVLIGRATLYGTAVAGERGAAHAIGLMREEIDRVLALLGCPSVSALNREHLMLPAASISKVSREE
jgi:isopentenyl diphosphate isomerase/L-lactate dehydrogenase-like FMN-dependent dehydrogenase